MLVNILVPAMVMSFVIFSGKFIHCLFIIISILTKTCSCNVVPNLYNIEESSLERTVMKNIIGLWTNFVKFG